MGLGDPPSSNVSLEVDSRYEQTSSALSEMASPIDSLFHLKPTYVPTEEKVEAVVHSMADLDVLTGPHRGPAIDTDLLASNPRICITCGVDFKSRASLHAHLTRHRHILGELEAFLRLPKYECRSCDGVINCSSMNKHKCFSVQQQDIKNRAKLLDKYGSPLVCILCRGRLLQSRVHLIIHIVMAHSIHRNPFKCPFCHTTFTSENLMMQEVHAFDHHAPELFMLTRKACFKMVRNSHGTVVDATVPFTCFFDALKLENKTLVNMFGAKASTTMENDPGSAITGGSKYRVCTASFTSLDEYTVHLCSVHCSLPSADPQETRRNNPVEEVRQKMLHSSRVPGLTVREMLRNQASGLYAAKNTADEEFSPPHLGSRNLGNRKLVLKKKKPTVKGRATITLRTHDHYRSSSPAVQAASYLKDPEVCRVCLDGFSDEGKLNRHIATYHLPENKKRLKHLTDKQNLTNLLDIELVCTDCYRTFEDNISLQVHMMVSHASKDWRHCGLCDYEFYSDNGGTPNHLRLVAFKTQEETENREPSLMGEGSSTDAWPLPAELMWRMILTHESLHRARLFPARKVPYLPINLIDQLITSCAIQGSMASYWLIRRAKEEVEGVQKDDDNMGGSAGMKTTQDMFMSGPEQRKCIIVDEDEVDAARVTLIRLIRPESWSEPGAETMRARMMSLRKPSHQLASISAKLPAWLAQHFNELGERNAAKQVEMDFVDNL